MNKIDKIEPDTIEQISKNNLPVDLFVLFQCLPVPKYNVDINMATAEPTPTTSGSMETKPEKVTIFFCIILIKKYEYIQLRIQDFQLWEGGRWPLGGRRPPMRALFGGNMRRPLDLPLTLADPGVVCAHFQANSFIFAYSFSKKQRLAAPNEKSGVCLGRLKGWETS